MPTGYFCTSDLMCFLYVIIDAANTDYVIPVYKWHVLVPCMLKHTATQTPHLEFQPESIIQTPSTGGHVINSGKCVYYEFISSWILGHDSPHSIRLSRSFSIC